MRRIAPMIESSLWSSGSVWGRVRTSSFHAPVTMISAPGAAAVSPRRMAVSREPNRADDNELILLDVGAFLRAR